MGKLFAMMVAAMFVFGQGYANVDEQLVDEVTLAVDGEVADNGQMKKGQMQNGNGQAQNDSCAPKPACKPKCEKPCKPKCAPCKPKCEPKAPCQPKPKCDSCKPKCEAESDTATESVQR